MTIKDLIRPIMRRILSIRQFRAVLPPPPKVPAFLAKQETGQAFKWAVVEMPLIVKASAPLETEELRFFSDIYSALEWLDGKPALIHSSGAIQYTPVPEM